MEINLNPVTKLLEAQKEAKKIDRELEVIELMKKQAKSAYIQTQIQNQQKNFNKIIAVTGSIIALIVLLDFMIEKLWPTKETTISGIGLIVGMVFVVVLMIYIRDNA